MIRRILAATLLLTTIPAYAQEDPWYPIDTTDAVKLYALTADLNAGNKTSTDATLWLKSDFRRNPSDPRNETRTLYKVNCPKRTYRTIQIAVHSGSDNWVVPVNSEVQHPVPDTNLNTIINILCAGPARPK